MGARLLVSRKSTPASFLSNCIIYPLLHILTSFFWQMTLDNYKWGQNRHFLVLPGASCFKFPSLKLSSFFIFSPLGKTLRSSGRCIRLDKKAFSEELNSGSSCIKVLEVLIFLFLNVMFFEKPHAFV